MVTQTLPKRLGRALAGFGFFLFVSTAVIAQNSSPPAAPPPIVHRVGNSDRLEMKINSGQILTLEARIAQAQVNDPEILVLTPLATNQVQIWAKKSGVTQVNLFDENKQVHTVNVVVLGDATELAMILQSEFPNVAIRVRPIRGAVILSGKVEEPEEASRILRVAEAYFASDTSSGGSATSGSGGATGAPGSPGGGAASGGGASGSGSGGAGGGSGASGDPRIINNLTIGGVQHIVLRVKVLEVSRTKLRNAGMDFNQLAASGGFIASGISGLLATASTGNNTVNPMPIYGGQPTAGSTMSFRVTNGGSSFFGFLNFLQQKDLAKILAEPTLVTLSGRPASFRVGGTINWAISGLGTASLSQINYGTNVAFVPIVLGNGRIHLEVHPHVSEIDLSQSTAGQPPATTDREVSTSVDMRAGQTLSIAGLVQTRIEAEHLGVPVISDVPGIGALFRNVKEQKNEVETLILVTPELGEPLDPQEVPPGGPGTGSTSPNDWQLYVNGELEVPHPCPPQCAVPQNPNAIKPLFPMEAAHPLPAVPPAPRPPQPPAPTVPAGSESSPNHVPATDSAAGPGSRGLPGYMGPVGYDER